MLDLPPDVSSKPLTEINVTVTDLPQTTERFIFWDTPPQEDFSNDPLFLKAQDIVNKLGQELSWKNATLILEESFNFVSSDATLSIEAQKQQVVTIFNYIIDLTDTPYLPDTYTDPLFKILVPPLVDLISKSFKGTLVPIISTQPFTRESFLKFTEELKNTFTINFRWQDLVTCIGDAISFIAGFSDLALQDKKDLSIEIINFIIDNTDTPYVPDSISDPLFKALARPVIEYIFDRL
ncbi:MAG: hypothetical protein FJZ63_07275 [Chlamydiae bacterium]|nr:hypothetical protein [Chlamydiota bacterium]